HDGDEVTHRLEALSDRWRLCAHMRDSDIAECIRADEIDILIDLSGMTAGARPNLDALRPAPRQVSYLGYPTTTGLAAVDFRVTDALIDPAGYERYNVERLLRCEGSMFCYRPDAEPDITPLPALSNGYVTFGSFNHLPKVSPHTLELWAAV